MSTAVPPAGGESRTSVEASGEQRPVTGDRTERGERGERRGRRRGRRGGGRHGGGAGREMGTREPGSFAAAPAGDQESGTAESSAGTYSNDSNSAHEQHPEPAAAARESYAPREQAEPRVQAEPLEQRESREAPARHEEPAAPIAHFEPSPPTESSSPRETKPYVVWSSAPPDRVVSGGGSRGPEE